MHRIRNPGYRPLLAILLVATGLAGCAGPKPLYEWGSYQPQVYAHFKAEGTSPEQQIAALEADLERISAKGAMPPPGYHAHLGMLHLKLGHADQAALAWNREKDLFPESTRFMDFLLNNMNKPRPSEARK